MRTNESHENIVELSVIREKKLRALSPFGPVRAGLTTSPKTNEDPVLTELLSSLERQVEALNFKSYTVLGILKDATKAIVAEPCAFTNDTTGTEDMLQ